MVFKSEQHKLREGLKKDGIFHSSQVKAHADHYSNTILIQNPEWGESS